MSTKIFSGIVHNVPIDVRAALLSSEQARRLWNDLTPLARNEWICWTTSVKRLKTAEKHIERLVVDITKAKRRPCCWPGCPHR